MKNSIANLENIRTNLEGQLARFFASAEYFELDPTRLELEFEEFVTELYEAKLHILSLGGQLREIDEETEDYVGDVSDLIPDEGKDVFDMIGDYETDVDEYASLSADY